MPIGRLPLPYMCLGINIMHPIVPMSPENTHKLMGFYVEVIILGVIYTLVHGFCFFKLFPIGCIGLTDLCSESTAAIFGIVAGAVLAALLVAVILAVVIAVCCYYRKVSTHSTPSQYLHLCGWPKVASCSILVAMSRILSEYSHCCLENVLRMQTGCLWSAICIYIHTVTFSYKVMLSLLVVLLEVVHAQICWKQDSGLVDV